MMLLAVDIGNTNMEFGIFSNQSLRCHFRLVTNHDITSDEIGLFMRQFFQIHDIPISSIQDVIITSVVPQVIYSVCNAMRKYLHRIPLVVGENISVNIPNHYKNPTEVGTDRLVNAYAGCQKYGSGIVIVDFGTATTFDVIGTSGAYLGGLIYPGIKISLDALTVKASKLPKVEIGMPPQVIGDDTAMSMQSGLVYGYTGAVVNIIAQIERELSHPVKVIATGGLSRFIGQHTQVIHHIERTLTLEGLQMIYQHHLQASS